jgi:hypothetical protein
VVEVLSPGNAMLDLRDKLQAISGFQA